MFIKSKSFLKFSALLAASIIFLSGCAGTGVALKVPPFEDKIPEISTGFYGVYKVVDGKVSESRGSEFLGEFVYLYKDDFFQKGKYFSGIKGSFLPNRVIQTKLKRSKLTYYWTDADSEEVNGEIDFKVISENKLTAVFITDKKKKETFELVFYKHQLAGNKMKIIPIAHRGVCYQPPNNYEGIFPANTVPAFETALRSGYKGFELDVHVTKDNRFIVSHDEDLSVATTARGLVEDKNLADFENALVVKSAAIPENKSTAKEAFIAAPIVSLQKVLEIFIDDPRLQTLVVDIKPDSQERIIKAARYDFKNFTKEQQKKILFLTREQNTAKLLRELCPYSDIALEGSIGPEPIEELEKYFPEAVGLPRSAHNVISFGANILLAFESIETATEEIKQALELSKKNNYKIIMWTFSKEWRLNFMRENEFFPDFILLDVPYYKFALQQMRFLKDKEITLDTIAGASNVKYKNPIFVRKFNEHVKDFWFKSRTFLELTYGLGKPNQYYSSNNFAKTGNFELKLGRSEVDVFSKTNVELNESYVFVSMMNSDYAIGSSDASDITTDVFRFGIGKTDGFGYVGSPVLIIPYVSTAFTWSKLTNYSGADRNDSEILDRYEGDFRFGDRFLYGLKAEIFSTVQLNVNYETGVVYPRHLFLNWFGSMAIMEAGYGGLSYITSKFMDDEPIFGPIVNVLVRGAYLYVFHLLREKDMNWPFSTEAPLRYDSFNLGMSVIF